MRGFIDERRRRVRRVVERATSGPLLVRALLFATTAVAVALALPVGMLLGKGAGAVLVGAVAVTVAPRSRVVTAVLLATGLSWVVTTVAFGDRVLAWRLVALAAAMYLVHTLAALAAVLPYDAVIPPGVLAAWLVRASLIVAISAGFGLFALAERPRLGDSSYLVASIAGVGIVGVLVWVLTRSVRR